MRAGTFFEENIKPRHRDAYWNDGKIFILSQEGYDPGEDIDWLADPYRHRSWRWLFNNFKWMDTLLYRHLVKGNAEAVSKCAEYFFSWYEFYIEGKREGEFLWKDDAVSFRAFRIAVITKYILESDEFTRAEKDVARQAVKLHYKELIDGKKFKNNNHGLFQVRGLMTLSAIHPDLVNLDDARRYAIKKVNYLWLQQYGRQGIHLENSTAYHQIIIREFEEIRKSPEFKGCKFIYNKSDVALVIDNSKYFFHPNGISTLFGDSNLSKRDLSRFVGDRIFNEAGYAFLAGHENSDKNSYLAIRTGFPSNIHRHSDDFSFEWSERGQVIFQDSGRYTYEYKDPYRIFLTSTRAHNTVTVNGSNYPWWGEFKKKDFYEGAVKQYESDQAQAKVVLRKKFADLGVTFNRSLELARGQSLRVTDTLRSMTENSYEQWFHFAQQFDYHGQDEAGRLIFQSDMLMLHVYPPQGVEIIVAKGQVQPYVQGWVSYQEKHLAPRWALGFRANNRQKFIFDSYFLLTDSRS